MEVFSDSLFDAFGDGAPAAKRAAPERAATPGGRPVKKQRGGDDEGHRHAGGAGAAAAEGEEGAQQQPTRRETAAMAAVRARLRAEAKHRELLHEAAPRKGCTHEVALPTCVPAPPPEDSVYNPVFPAEPVRKWKFELDPFQKGAIACMERGDSVLVSAHTSAGKTVVAEYAIALGLKRGQRVIYTSPIKALSNQKFRELQEEFKDVGLMTGDITINPSASCLVMTTEILRSMLYRGSEVIREVSWVVFDEIHYMRNKERGVVWEETIILLPDKVKFVFLSATIPNALEFAQWIAHVHSQPCHVVYTDMRPVPLQHYLFPSGGDGLHLVVDEKGNFREDNFHTALASLAENPTGRRRAKNASQKPDCFRIIKMIMDRAYDPVIIFSFSKRECESLALQMTKLDFIGEAEKKAVESVFKSAIGSLSASDQQLPQIVNMLPLLQRGIGIHHGGLLPILKEVIEILFQEGLIKALFATETFSMGLNMPARTVVFTSFRKFDGAFRDISPGEYIQMSGRAGRRGLDDRGIVVLMVDERLEPAQTKAMVFGGADALNSAFRLSYNMVLNLLRVEGVDPEHLICKSFRQFQLDRSIPDVTKKVAELEEQMNAITVADESVVSEYYFIRANLEKLREKLREYVNQPLHSVAFLQPGRVVKLRPDASSTAVVYSASGSGVAVQGGWGAVISFSKRQVPAGTESIDPYAQNGVAYVVEVLLNGETVVSGLAGIDGLSSVRVYMPHELRTAEARRSVSRSVAEVEKRFPDGVPLLDPVDDMKIDDPGFKRLVRQAEELEDRLATDKRFSAPAIAAEYGRLCERMRLDGEIRALKRTARKEGECDAQLRTELRCMRRVLRRLGYTNADDVIEVKGRVAAELSAGNEIVLTELIFANLFNDLTPEQVVALLSVFCWEERGEGPAMPTRPDLAEPFRQVLDVARRVARVSKECKLDVDEEEFVQAFKPNVVDIMYAWCTGASFADILKMGNDIFEGSLIRSMRTLHELLKQLVMAAKAIGNGELEAKFAAGISKLHKDIVFAASLYL
eukprot:m51a1_g9696 putative ATP-dependent RNA helicase (1034) ;mRNA; f:1368526-1372611